MPTTTRPRTVDELEEQAAALELGAKAARHRQLEEFVRAGIAGQGDRQDAARKHVAAAAAAEEAARHVEEAKAALSVHTMIRDGEVDAAAAARSNGEYKAALEHDEAAAIAAAKMRIAEHQLRDAERAEAEQRVEVDLWRAQDTDEIVKHADREIERRRVEDGFDAQERQAIDYRLAAADLRDAERLEAALPDLEARGVVGVERVRTAAAEHRRLATEAMERGWAVDDGATGAPSQTTTSDAAVPEEIEMPPMDMRRTEPEEIEMPPMDMRRAEPEEIEMKADVTDKDGDGLTDEFERRIGTDPSDKDTDNDGLTDFAERRLGTKPTTRDSDGDGFDDGSEIAQRHNPLRPDPPHPYGRAHPTGGVDGAVVPTADDPDADRLDELQERMLGTSANDPDSDGDGLGDWVESIRGTNPLSRFSDGKGDRTSDLDDAMVGLVPPATKKVSSSTASATPAAVDRAPVDPDVTLIGETGRHAFLAAARAQIGDPYRFGAETDLDDPDPGAFDSSELVQWAAAQAGIKLPDGSWKQYQHLAEKATTVSVQDALRTPGALVFGFSSDPLASADRPARSYVGISLGNGKVLDVSERTGEVREMDPEGFYTHAAVMPELIEDLDSDGDGDPDDEERLFHSDPFDATRTVRDPKYATSTSDTTTDPVDPDPVVADPVPAAADPGAADPVAADPIAADPIAPDPVDPPPTMDASTPVESPPRDVADPAPVPPAQPSEDVELSTSTDPSSATEDVSSSGIGASSDDVDPVEEPVDSY